MTSTARPSEGSVEARAEGMPVVHTEGLAHAIGHTTPLSPLPEVLQAVRLGRPIILVDDEERENEGDLVLCASMATADRVNFMVRYARGLVCLSLTPSQASRLELKPVEHRGPSKHGTAFTQSIDAKDGISTGISAADRALTILVASSVSCTPGDLVSPGHVFPLQARPDGVLERRGHTEGSIDLMRLAWHEESHYKPDGHSNDSNHAAVICEILNDDGTMARLPDLVAFAQTHAIDGVPIPICSIAQIVQAKQQQLKQSSTVSLVPSAQCQLTTQFGRGVLRVYGDREDCLVWLIGNPSMSAIHPLVRIHSQCLTGDLLSSLHCDCQEQLHLAQQYIHQHGYGALVYMLKDHEGRGIGLTNKILAYAVQQDLGLDTIHANRALALEDDSRDYRYAAHVLHSLGMKHIHLLTANPEKCKQLKQHGIEVVQTIALTVQANHLNVRYLQTKQEWFNSIK